MKIWALLAIAVGLVYGALVVAGAAPADTAQSLIQGSLGSAKALEGTMKHFTPLLIAGVAVFFALRAGLFNIGVEGQFTVGALVCAVVALRMPGWLGLIVGILAAAVAGALWAYPAGWIKAMRGGHEVISTIMLNNIAGQLSTAAVAGPFKDPSQQGTTTASIDPLRMLPAIWQEPKISVALLVAVALVVAMWRWLARTVPGYELQVAGANAKAATLAGIDAPKVTIRAMAISGAIGGIAGALQVVAYEGRFFAGFSSGYGFDALGVALLAGSSPLILFPSAALFAILAKGSTTIQVMNGVPKGISFVILGLLIVIFAAIRYRKVPVKES